MTKIKSNFDKFALVAALSGFVLSSAACGGKPADGAGTADPASSFTAEEVKIIKENLLKDGLLAKLPYQSLVSIVAPVEGLTVKGIQEAISGGDSNILNILINCGIIAVKADKSGYEAANKLTPEAVEFANSFSKFVKASTDFNTSKAVKMHVGAGTCNVLAVAAA